MFLLFSETFYLPALKTQAVGCWMVLVFTTKSDVGDSFDMTNQV